MRKFFIFNAVKISQITLQVHIKRQPGKLPF